MTKLVLILRFAKLLLELGVAIHAFASEHFPAYHSARAAAILMAAL